MSTSYDQSYTSTPDLFGAGPERTVVAYADRLDLSLPVLDVGCGQGRNTLYLARRGLTVDALDPSLVAIETVLKEARGHDLAVRGHQTWFEGFALDDEPRFGGVLVFGVIQLLTRPEVERLLDHLERWTAPGGLVFVTAFTTADAGHAERVAAPELWKPIGPGSFRGPADEVRTYLEPGELRERLHGWEVIHYVEELGPEHRHGDGPPERHALVETVFTSL